MTAFFLLHGVCCVAEGWAAVAAFFLDAGKKITWYGQRGN
jgi:hypothetical protein